MVRFPSFLRSERGFTIIEVLVASTLLLIGLTGTVEMMNVANRQTSSNQGREAGTNVVREVIEKAATVPYDALATGAITTELQKPQYGLGTLSAVARRGRTYNITVTGCSVDDRADGYGSHAGGGFCSDSGTTGTTVTD